MQMIKRPKPGEDEDDLLRLQTEFQQSNECSVQIKRPAKKITPEKESNVKLVSTNSTCRREVPKKPKLSSGGRFTLNLDTLPEVDGYQVLFDVEERNAEWLYPQSTTSDAQYLSDIKKYSEDDGFPDVIDLSSYFRAGLEKRQADPGKSFFATEFDRINGRIKEATCTFEEEQSMAESTEGTSNNFEEENLKRIAAMKEDELTAARKEIEEKLDPKLLEFLKNRHKSKAPKLQGNASRPQVSRFKQEKIQQKQGITENKDEPTTTSEATEAIRQLEILEEFADWKAEEKYDRLAADAVQLDLLTKCARRVMPRQAQQATRLFDLLKVSAGRTPNAIFELARSKIEDIKKLYLEEISVDGKIVHQFANGLNPVVDGSWMLRPIRAVLDAIQLSERTPTADDIDVVRLTLLWTALLFTERPTLFYTMVEPSDFYVRLAELYMLGPEVFTESTIEECISILLEQFLVPTAGKERLTLRLERPVAGLDAFMPFYEELLNKYEEFSIGHPGFTKMILLGAYGNSSLSDALECQLTLWSGRRNVVREMTTCANVLKPLLDLINETSSRSAKVYEETLYVQYSMLLSEYAGALHSRRVEKERNSGAFAIAANELGSFVLRHTRAEKNVELSTQKLKDFDSLVYLLREAVKNILVL